MKTKLFYASFLFVLACGPASKHADSLSSPKSSDDITTLDRTPSDRDQPMAPTPPVLPAPEAAHGFGTQTNPNAPPQSILSKPYFEGPNLGGEMDSPFGTADTSVGAGFNPRRNARSTRVPDEPGLFEITLSNTGSGWLERFLLYVPTIPATQRAPLLVVFHKYGVSHWDAYYHTTFFAEAARRGWFAVAPLGASQRGFSSLESQINVQAALDFTNTYFNIDRNRVYGVGFSMGGGSVTSYAARHVDLSGLMFAAIVNHTGGVSLANTWALEYDDNDADDNTPNWGDNLEVPDILEYWYGGPPSVQAFNYQRCSMIDIDPNNGSIGIDTDMSRNVSHVPVRDWMANSDPMVYLRDQTTAFDSHIQGQNLNNTMTTVTASVHSWSTLDDAGVCDWLSQFTLQLPRTASTLADQDGTYFWFQVNQTRSGTFTPFNWTVDPIYNRISLWNTSNLARVSVDASAAGLVYAGNLKVNMNTADGSGDQVLLQNLPYAPILVKRDGQNATGTWDPVAHTFLIDELSNTGHQWVLTF
jgi:hypothetical protein